MVISGEYLDQDVLSVKVKLSQLVEVLQALKVLLSWDLLTLQPELRGKLVLKYRLFPIEFLCDVFLDRLIEKRLFKLVRAQANYLEDRHAEVQLHIFYGLLLNCLYQVFSLVDSLKSFLVEELIQVDFNWWWNWQCLQRQSCA